jgi:Fe-S cluster biogenesis protein NfuA
MARPETSAVKITAEPIDGARCRFRVDQPLYPGRWAYFADAEQARGVPLVERLFALEGVLAVLLAHDKVTVTKTVPAGLPVVGAAVRVVRRLLGDRSPGVEHWPALGARIGEAIRDHLATGAPAVPDSCPVAVPGAAELRARVQRVLDDEVNPVIAGHGGGVTILDLKDNVLYLQMWGGCQGCGLADVTLKHGVEAAIRDAVPEIGEIFDLTDHKAGRNPYVRQVASR